MSKKKRELTTEEEQRASRLREIWNEKKKELKLSQEKIAFECGWNGQSAFSQYYNGFTPLNTDAVLKIAKVLKIHPTKIMPEIAEFLPDNQSMEIREKNLLEELDEETIEFAKAWKELPTEQKNTLAAFVYATQKQIKKVA